MSLSAPPEQSTEFSESSDSFLVQLEEFSGPFDVLLSLIAKHRLDVTALALHQVTDDFIGYIKERGDEWSLDEATEFLVIAATLLDLKAARLLPGGEVEDDEDLAILEARDLLLARLLQYRAFKLMSGVFGSMMGTAGRIHPRTVGLDARFAKLLPDVEINMSPDDFANMAARALEPKLPEVISIEHIHAAKVSVREQAAIMVDRLKRAGNTTFRQLTLDCDTTLLVVARFLALLELYRDGVILFDQPIPLGELHVRWVEGMDENWDREIDEFDHTEVQFAELSEEYSQSERSSLDVIDELEAELAAMAEAGVDTAETLEDDESSSESSDTPAVSADAEADNDGSDDDSDDDSDDEDSDDDFYDEFDAQLDAISTGEDIFARAEQVAEELLRGSAFGSDDDFDDDDDEDEDA